MKRKILCLLCLLMFYVGCQPTKQIQLNKEVTLSFFYVESCSQCRAFKKQAIPTLEKTFGKQLTIHQYDLDEPLTEPIYDKVIQSLDGFDEEYYGNGPFIVLDGYFALLGYNSGDEEYLIKDIQLATSGKELGYELEGFRFLFK